MRILRESCFLITIFSIISSIRCYDVTLSKNNFNLELNKWENFTVHVESRGHVYTDNIIMEVNYTKEVKVSPKIVEIQSKNFSNNWCHIFYVYALKPGSSRINVNFGDMSSSQRDEKNDVFIDVDIMKMKVLETYAAWCHKYYYIFSSASVYPQVFLQFLRLSVVGLDMDYVCFNIIGHLSYSVYTVFMYSQMDAHEVDNQDKGFSVTLSENMYSIHGLIFSIILGIQATKYFGIDKRITVLAKELISFYGIVFTFGYLLAKFHIIRYSDFLLICKYIHVASTSTKYFPQLYKNYFIRSTFGWNIWNSNLESLGCIAVITNLLITSYNYDNWNTILREYLFWMACAILLQHIAFIVQHYILYKRWSEFDLEEFREFTLYDKITMYEQRLDHC